MSHSRDLSRLGRTGIPAVATAAALRDLVEFSGDPPNAVQTLGSITLGDNGGGLWWWSPTSEAVDDGENVLTPVDQVGPGRWLRVIEPGGGEGGGITNLSNTPSATEVTIESSSGTNTSVGGATGSVAGFMVADDKSKLDELPEDVMPAAGGTLSDYGETSQAIEDAGGAIVIDISQGQSISLSLDSDATSLTFSNPSGHEATSFSMLLYTDGYDVLDWASLEGWFGAVPDLSSGGTHGFGFELIDEGWYGTHKGQVVI